MRLISWNVNGIRSVAKKGFLEWLAGTGADIVCLQETKARPEQVTEIAWPGDYERFWNAAEKPGYSGTAIFTRVAPLAVTYGIGAADHDREGRVITAEFDRFFLVNVYVPNAKRDLSRLPYRQAWDRDFLAYLKGLEATKPVVWCGDLNVAHTPLDLARPKGNERNHGFTAEERAGFDAFVAAGFVDTFREFHPGVNGHYTWWSQMGTARAKNVGWRIDYFLVSAALRPALKSAVIYPEVRGSDHCPVGIELSFPPA